MDKNQGFLAAAALLPGELRKSALSLGVGEMERAEELRLRAGRPPTVLISGSERPLCDQTITPQTLLAVLEIATGASLHAARDSLRQGFITAKGGVRIGVCGTASGEARAPADLRDISSLALRIPRQLRGIAQGLLGTEKADDFCSTLIISPPGAGKTTLLRDYIRLLSEKGLRISLADERGEVAAMCGALPMFDLGPGVDVLTGAPKDKAVLMLLRAMNPEVIAMDEITSPEDAAACLAAANCGVRLLATAHGADVSDLRSRRVYRTLMDAGVFRRAVLIKRQGQKRVYETEELSC